MNISSIFDYWYAKKEELIINNFKNFIKIDTVSPNELEASEFLEKYLESINYKLEKKKINEETYMHYLYNNHPRSDKNKENYNFFGYPDTNDNQNVSVLFNVHIDVVPPSLNQIRAFDPYIEENFLYGRGACDTKNNLIMLVEAIRFLKDSNIEISKNVKIDLVIEEEITGKGTLSSNLNGVEADLVIVMEPTELKTFRGHRGIITTEIEVKGESVHMGNSHTGINAIEESYKVIESLKRLEKELISESIENEGFNVWEKPVQINIGKINGGEWAGSVPEYCTLTANIGFTDLYSISQIKNKIIEHIQNDSGLTNPPNIYFNELVNPAFLTNNDNSYVKEFVNHAYFNHESIPRKLYGWRVSCDAHYYYHLNNLPTIIFGSGKLSDAHSDHERVNLNEFKKGILMLANYLSN